MTRSDFFKEHPWGLFVHFLSGPYFDGHAAENIVTWNRVVDSVDVDKLASQIASTGAHYFYLTLGQNSGYYCSPSATLDSLCGWGAGSSQCSRRDLVAELGHALEKYNIPLLVYLPSHAPMSDEAICHKLECVPAWDFQEWGPRDMAGMQKTAVKDGRIRHFMRSWEAVVEEWSRRWGTLVHGWWFDGCYYADRLYNFPDEPNFHSLARAVRSGNQNAMFAINGGVKPNPVCMSDEEDYTAGETMFPEWVCVPQAETAQALCQVLTYAGTTWGAQPPLRFTADQMACISANVVNGGGAITWDIPYHHEDVTLEEGVLEHLRSFNRLYEAYLKDGVNTRLSVNIPPSRTLDGALHDGQGTLTLYRGRTVESVRDIAIPAGNGQVEYHDSPAHWGGNVRTVPAYIQKDIRTGKLEVIPVESPLGNLGDISVALDGEMAVIQGTIYEKRAESAVKPLFWQGSCLETFVSENGRITHRFFPADEATQTGYSQQGKEFFPENDYSYHLEWLNEDAYRFQIRFQQPSGAFWRLELKVASFREGTHQEIFMCKSEFPWGSDEQYLLVQ